MSIKRFSITAQKHVETDFDHLIILKDNTHKQAQLSFATINNLSDEVQSPALIKTNSLTHSIVNSGSRLIERKDSLRRHIAERKYQRRWLQEAGVEEEGEISGSSSDEDDSKISGDKSLKEVRLRRAKTDASDASLKSKGKAREFPNIINAKKEDLRKKGTAAYRKARATGRRYRKEEFHDKVGEIDILYENQRGSFFFGIPLFSSKSLLPTDSAAWTNRFHHPSPVTIVNAQVPDPSWEWSWKNWFVDMTGDVDEEGWQYSFAFRGSKWHGVSVWWHAFVRRRRWIRKRVKRRPTDDIAGGGHNLTPEYFTIHSRRGSLTPEVGGIRNGSIVSSGRNSVDSSRWLENSEFAISDDETDEIIADIPSLLKAFKGARIDREKILAMEKFVHTGSEEVAYLAENIPQLMSSMIFQNSRRKILGHLLHVLYAVQAKRSDRMKGEAAADISPEDEDKEERYIDGLGRAVEAADGEVQKLEYWSDIKRVQHSGYAGPENHRENEAEEAEWTAGHGCLSHHKEDIPKNKISKDNVVSEDFDSVTKTSMEDDPDNEKSKNLSKKDKGKARADV